ICTYSCPTCYCFDIQVKNWGEEGYRFRCYDSCMYKEYSLMAGGHNPREASVERFRNRFLHKLQFFNERYGTPLCTGCGRCIVVCPAGISIVSIINEIKEAELGAKD
ncbi:MAG: 4Fe-4S dicluster domain-containing protein, partial [Firmicutes bacterium]|nr:4Fe-4S dicluster domain-containing protein [Bacillota bacterium]